MKHHIHTPLRTGWIEVKETPTAVYFNLELSRYGDLPDAHLIQRSFAHLIGRYHGDPRPFVIRHPLTGQVSTVKGTESGAVVSVEMTH